VDGDGIGIDEEICGEDHRDSVLLLLDFDVEGSDIRGRLGSGFFVAERRREFARTLSAARSDHAPDLDFGALQLTESSEQDRMKERTRAEGTVGRGSSR
jgi:hypothetical protein